MCYCWSLCVRLRFLSSLTRRIINRRFFTLPLGAQSRNNFRYPSSSCVSLDRSVCIVTGMCLLLSLSSVVGCCGTYPLDWARPFWYCYRCAWCCSIAFSAALIVLWIDSNFSSPFSSVRYKPQELLCFRIVNFIVLSPFCGFGAGVRLFVGCQKNLTGWRCAVR